MLLPRPLLLLSAGLIFASSLAQAEEKADLKAASQKFFTSMEGVSQQAPAVSDAAGLVKVLDSWAGANQALAQEVARYLAANPAPADAKEHSPEMAVAAAQLSKMRDDFPELGQTVGLLVKKYSGEETVKEAVERFRASLAGLRPLHSPGAQ